MENFNSSTNAAAQTTEIYTKEILAGNVAQVRLQIIEAVESLGYDIIEDEPQVFARRSASGWGKSMMSADVLDYARTLTIRLKSVGASSTRVIFDYVIKHPILNKGEKNIVVQEARTIAAICRQSIQKICPACETESTDDSRFCRRCGAPLTNELAELEVLRMMAEVRAAKTSVVASAVLMLLALILFVLIFTLFGLNVIDRGGLIVLILIGISAAVFAAMSSGFGWNRINRALKKPEKPIQQISRVFPQSIETGEFDELPVQKPVASITEGTTNLLDKEWTNRREDEKNPIARRRETNDLIE